MHDETNQIYPAYYLGVVQTVDASHRTVDIQPYGLIETYRSVPILADPANVSLPKRGDVAVLMFNNRMRPMIVGFYPKYIRDDTALYKYYPLQEGDILIQSPDGGGRMMLLQNGVMRFANWHNQGLEIDPNAGAMFVRTPSMKEVMHGLQERSGWIRRKNTVSLFGAPSVFDLDSLEVVIQKLGTISAPGTIVHDTVGGIEMYEKKTEIKVPGTQTTNDPIGTNLYEETIGTGVIPNNPVGTVYTETVSVQSGLPLRKKTVYYDPTGSTELITEEVDTNGNMRLFINGASASLGIKLDTLVPTLLNLLNLTVNTIGGTINLNGNTDFMVLATKLMSYLGAHVHTGIQTGSALSGTSPQLVAPLADPTLIATVKVLSS